MVQEARGCSRGSHKLQKPIEMVNQTIFSNYHRFGSSSTMIFDEADSGDPIAGVSPGASAPRRDVPQAKSQASTEHKEP